MNANSTIAVFLIVFGMISMPRMEDRGRWAPVTAVLCVTLVLGGLAMAVLA